MSWIRWYWNHWTIPRVNFDHSSGKINQRYPVSSWPGDSFPKVSSVASPLRDDVYHNLRICRMRPCQWTAHWAWERSPIGRQIGPLAGQPYFVQSPAGRHGLLRAHGATEPDRSDARLMTDKPVPPEAIPRLVDRSDDAAKYGHHFAVHRRRYFNKMKPDIDRALVCSRGGGRRRQTVCSVVE